jgi:hypothetical protein
MAKKRGRCPGSMKTLGNRPNASSVMVGHLV